jgi:hypothetical protein
MDLPRRPILLLAALAALATGGCAAVPGRGGDDVRALPAWERERPVPSAPLVTDWLWPFGHDEETTGSRSAGFRPLLRHVVNDAGDRTEVLFPLYRTEDDRGMITTRLLPFYWHDEMPGRNGPDSDTAILPILFWGSDPEEGSYFLLFPLGGIVRQKFLSDSTTFVLFPLYAGTRTGDWRGHHFLWPLIHWGSDGKAHHAFHVLPLYGENVRDGVYSRHTVLWPVVQWGAEDLDKKHPRHGWMVWPLFGTEGSEDGQRSNTALWPFFTWADGPRAWERSLPYPFFRHRKDWEDGPGGRVLASELFWLWPFYGRFDRKEEEHTRFYMWPFVFTWDRVDAGLREKALAVMPFWRGVSHERAGGEPVDSWWKLWPFAQGESRADGTSGWSALSIIPWFRWEEFDANWGVFFELARVRRDADGSKATDFLFSLVRSREGPAGEHKRIPLVMRVDRDATGSSWSILEGLLGGETAADGGTSIRLLWFLRIPLAGGRP